MSDLKRIYRIFQLISRLRSPLGVSKKNVAVQCELTERTIERYFELLDDLGLDLDSPKFEGNKNEADVKFSA